MYYHKEQLNRFSSKKFHALRGNKKELEEGNAEKEILDIYGIDYCRIRWM